MNTRRTAGGAGLALGALLALGPAAPAAEPSGAKATATAPLGGQVAVGAPSAERTVSGRVVLPNGSAPSVPVVFYVQDLNLTPPQVAAIHASEAEGGYAFSLGVGRWRVIPTSPEYDFQPAYRDYAVGLPGP